MPTSKRNPKRSVRTLSAKELRKSRELCALVELDREEILAQGRQFKAEVAAELQLQQVLSALKSARQAQGLSLSAMKERTGIGKAALSRLENDPRSNPTVGTVLRVATALGKKIAIRLVD